MKISELKNAPEWLVLADTKNADVEITSYGWVIWNSGDFLGGNFLGGNFLGGNFLGGNFRGGNFLGGNFLGGAMAPTCKWVYGITKEGNIKIGCKEMTVKQWDKWFKSNEEFSTKRNTVAFKKIFFCYKMSKAYLKEFTINGEFNFIG